jgi:hypothetical protein
VASFNGSRTLTGIRSGQTAIAAGLAGVSSSPVILTVDSLISISCLEMSTAPYLPLDTVQLAATATTRLSANLPVSNRVNWVSSDPARLMGVANGIFIPIVPGFYGVHAELNGRSSDPLLVDVWNVTALDITPTLPDTMHRGDTLRFAATATIENHDQQVMTNHAVWTSSNPVSGSFIGPGLFVAGSAGQTLAQARIGIVATAQVPVSVVSVPVLTETFESYPPGTFDGGTHWTVSVMDPGRAMISAIAHESAKSCLLLDTSYYSECGMVTRSDAFSPVVQGLAEADMRTNGDGLAFEILGSAGYPNATVSFRNGGIYTFSTTSSVFLQHFQADTWYHIAVDFDCLTGTYNVYIDGVARASQMNFVNFSNAVTELWVGIMNGYQGNYSYVDNITLSK